MAHRDGPPLPLQFHSVASGRSYSTTVPMKQHNDLHDLIQSLSKSEKRYFRLYTSLYEGEKDYMHIFDILEAQDTYDEEAMRAQLKDKVALEHLHVTKNYLFNLILKALKSYSTADYVEDQLRETLHSIRLLYDRKIYGKAESMLRKAKKAARLHNKQTLLLDIISLETGFTEFYYGEQDIAKRDAALAAERNEVLTELSNYHELMRVYHQAGVFHLRYSFARTEEHLKKWEELMSSPVLQLPPHSFGFKSRVIYYGIYRTYYMVIGEMEKAFEAGRLAVEQYEPYPEVIADQSFNYLKTLYNAYHIASLVGNYEAGQCFINRMHKLNLAWRGINIQDAINVFQMDLFLSTHEYDKAFSLVPSVEKFIKDQEENNINVSVATVRLQLAYFYCAVEQYDNALTQLNYIIAMREIDEARIVFANARIMNVIVHFELGNLDYLPHLIRTTYQYFYKRENLFKTEKLLLSYLKAFARAEGELERRQLFKKGLQELKQLQKDPFERLTFKELPVLQWLEKKVNSKARSATGT